MGKASEYRQASVHTVSPPSLPLALKAGVALAIVILASLLLGILDGKVPAASAQEVAVSDSEVVATNTPTLLVKPDGSPFRVGIQAGHWKTSELPTELASLRTSTGASGSGWREVDINLDIAKRVVALLEQQGVQTDLIPSTVPA